MSRKKSSIDNQLNSSRRGNFQGRGRGRGNSRTSIVLQAEDANLYKELMEKIKKEDPQALKDQKTLAQLTMAARVRFECSENGGKKEIYLNRINQEPSISFTLTAKNFAAIILRVPGIETIPNAFAAAPDKESTGYPSEHAERYALGDAINQAIDHGWKPQDQGRTLGKEDKLSTPPTYEELSKFTEALKSVSITIFTEKSFCTTPPSKLPQDEQNCNTILKPIFSGENKNVYVAINFGDKEQKIRDARAAHYKNNLYADQNAFLDKYEDLKNEVIQNPHLKIGIVGSEVTRKNIAKQSNAPFSTGIVAPSTQTTIPSHTATSAKVTEKKTSDHLVATTSLNVTHTSEMKKRKRYDSFAEVPETPEKEVTKKQRKHSIPFNTQLQSSTYEINKKTTSETAKKIKDKETKSSTSEKQRAHQRKRQIELAPTEELDLKRQKTWYLATDVTKRAKSADHKIKIERELKITRQETQNIGQKIEPSIVGQMMRQQQGTGSAKSPQEAYKPPKLESFKFSSRQPSNTTTSQVTTHSTAQQDAFLTQVQQQPVSRSTSTKKRAKECDAGHLQKRKF